MAARRKGARGGKTIPRPPSKTFKLPRTKGKGKRARPCPGNFNKMCQDINAWAREWEIWGERVKQIVNCIVDQCCPACDPGDPDPVPKPPSPPFA
ncbi:MAG TPA: hypothetical protein VJ717_05290 [Gemmatimonadaceae bacterium]|nr:hypothetical protein [Gemmatimonadaceae bacterium]